MYTCQREGPQMGQNRGVLFKEVSAFQSCPSIEVLYIIIIILYTVYITVTTLCYYAMSCSPGLLN